LDCAIKTVRIEGFQGLYKGWTAHYFRLGVSLFSCCRSQYRGGVPHGNRVKRLFLRYEPGVSVEPWPQLRESLFPFFFYRGFGSYGGVVLEVLGLCSKYTLG
ncbi:unnamed protein product, partial [Discosporangium mesarthrocarpum]